MGADAQLFAQPTQSEDRILKREIRLALVVLIVLAAATWIVKTQMDDRQNSTQKQEQELLFPQLSAAAIQKIELELGATKVNLEKRKDKWWVRQPEFPANPLFVDMLIEGILKTPRGTELSNDVAKHDQFELGGRAWVIRLFDASGKELTRIYVGKSDATYRGTYIRLQEDATVHYVPVAYGVFLRRPSWFDRTIWQVPLKAVQAFQLEGPDGFLLTRSENGFLNPDTHREWPFDAPEIKALLHFQATDIRFENCPTQADVRFGVQIEGQWMWCNLSQHGETWLGSRDSTSPCYVLANELLKRLEAFHASEE